MGWIILLIILGALLFIAELILLPGLTLAAVGSFCCFVGAVWLAFLESNLMGFITLGASLVVLAILTAVFLRSATWKKISLHTDIPDALETHKAKVGNHGKTLTRLAPMGKVVIHGEIIEAKTMGEYIDEGSEVEIIGMENMNIIVKLKQ